MKAILSDIHGNIEALTAVLADIHSRGIEEIVCLGDIIGYGANAAECLSEIRKLTSHIVLGNHESGCVGKTPLDHFNQNAKLALMVNKKSLPKEAIDFCASLPRLRVIRAAT